jgi:redox-sensitive bicupin YhaK (pirin superfamily)
MYWKEEVPVVRKGDSSVTLVAGNLDDVQALSPPPDSWAAGPENEVVVAIIDLAAGEQLILPALGEMANRNLYFFEGESLTLTSNSSGDSQTLMKGQGVSLNNKYRILEGGNSPSRLLWLQGCPINEPVAKYGPFVMNTPEEIQQAMNRFRRTQFGGWPWDKHDPVHRPDKGRFAQFPDGELVEK